MESDFDTITYGTPLQPLEEDEVPDKKHVQDLTVRDENGRRRFHGAFTGGFSAGYYNTVGTKEGWSPSYFKSSRYSKADKRQQRPEDFMDTEDLNQFGIAHRTVQATKDFRRAPEETSSQRSAWNSGNLLIPGGTPLEDLIKPVNNHIGIRLLRAMGWKPGQGIGPRTKKKPKPKVAEAPKSNVKVYGCVLPTELSDDEYDEYALAFTFAPEDISTLPYLSKENVHGIGYAGIGDTDFLGSKYSSEDPNTTKAILKTGRKIAISGKAFGVGAFEDDDEDIYAKDDMTQYDFELTDPQKAAKKSKKAITNQTREVKREIEGFHLANKAPIPKKNYPPPEIPADFVPNRRMITAAIVESFPKPPPSRQERTSASSTTKFLNRHVLSAAERAEMLGDKFQSKPPNYLTETKVPDAIPSAVSLEEAWKTRLSSLIKDNTKLEWAKVNNSESNLKPFAADLDKQKRYDIYLEMQKAGRSDFSAFQPSMTHWEKEKEKEEFQRATVLFRPLTGKLSQKFVSKGTQLENDHEEIMAARQKNAKDAEEKLRSDVKVKRSDQEWHPDKLLCRCFNVPNPFPDSATVGLIGAKRTKTSIFEFLPTTEDAVKSCAPSISKTMEKPLEKTPMSLKFIPPVVNDDKKNKILEKLATNVTEKPDISPQNKISLVEKESEAPSLDLFKAIFVDSDSSQSEEEIDIDDHENEKDLPQDLPPIQEKAPIKTIIRASATGIFACLNEFNSEKNGDSSIREMVDDKTVQPQMTNVYGPTLPPDLSEVSLNKDGRSRKDHKAKKRKEKRKKKKDKRKYSDCEDDLNHKLKKRLKELSKRK